MLAIGRTTEIKIDKTAAVIVQQMDDEISIAIVSVVGAQFQVTAGQARELSRSLAVAAENAEHFRASAKT
ncbi:MULTISPECIES: hypothetical protein [Bradyrhizobium]|uniref:hypothetical protein n=1 Tax=Bradyrhizobium TaxID=374 RepID=UPI00155EB6E4|nr:MULTISPECIES: hypothetical protein [Bradyrhizobium]MDD1522418.1 hypothetical protein [Bradyrhizobium sp. WBAH30]MDD1546342.1 hypothetical protein [Bradyrhizobium sp. WBAH41]MDD1560506.1 hypothetical protein [Bradyrhizobium sp. WBAH23]MDD1567348.1 hypothetical protein [Bradyrhizobium sp. WBAH33]MDD1594159.1 hypothetical protein [Bradyrhizobium sp. WBAH42]